MRGNKTARGSFRYRRASALVKQQHSIAQLERDRIRRENFERGCRWAGLLMVGLFVVLSFGCVMFGW